MMCPRESKKMLLKKKGVGRFPKQGPLNYLVWGDQTMQIYGNLGEFPYKRNIKRSLYLR